MGDKVQLKLALDTIVLMLRRIELSGLGSDEDLIMATLSGEATLDRIIKE